MIPDGGGSPTSGSRDTGCRADAGRGGGGKERGGKGPLGTNDVHGRVTAGKWSCRMRSSMEEGRILGGDQNPHGLQPGGLQRGVRCPCRALESATRRSTIPERVTIFTDAQAGIKQMASDEPGPGQKYALQARKHIATLRRSRPGIIIEIRWCPAHKGVPGNEKADERAKLAAEKPDARGVEWLAYSDRAEACSMPLPRSLANIKREISEKKWDNGQEAGPPRRSTRCRKDRGRTAWWLEAPRG